MLATRISGVYCCVLLLLAVGADGPDEGASIIGMLLDAEDGSVCDTLGDNVDWIVVGSVCDDMPSRVCALAREETNVRSWNQSAQSRSQAGDPSQRNHGDDNASVFPASMFGTGELPPGRLI